jgi:AraC-like DNA-binding protein
MRKFLTQLKLVSGTVLQISDIGPVVRTFDELIKRGARDTPLTRQLCEALIRQILITTVEDGLEAGESDTQAFATFERVRDHIARHYLEADSVESIASACSLDAAYLSRLFSRFQNESPYRYLTRLRMEHAARLLLESDVTVREVAKQVGIADPFRFSRVFKSVHRLPPSRFRQGLQSQPSPS